MKNKKVLLTLCIFLLIALAITGCRPARRPVPTDPAPVPGQQQPRDAIPPTDPAAPEGPMPPQGTEPREIAPGDPVPGGRQPQERNLEDPIPQS
ncbi:MAG: hypothetical protein JJT76_12450 [Clostridiaceae bacterium]|nr:hypothetical protein [Clostridiaceae bacterium]